MNFRVISYVLGWVLNIEAGCMCLPLLWSVVTKDGYSLSYLTAILLCLLFGLPFTVKAPKDKTMYAKEGFVTVAFSWILISIFGSVPFMVSGFIPNFFDAVFETASGFTTTGASILTNVEILPRSLLLWRSFTHWIGGMGVLVFLVALLPLSGGENFHLVRAESPGPSVSKLVPKVKTTAKILYGIYIMMTAVQIVLLLLGGLDLFEALTLSFGTAGTGGFAIKNSGLADYSSYVQVVITVFMIIFGIDFSFYYLLLIRKFKSALKMDEVRSYLLIILTAIILITINVYNMFGNILDALKHVAFQVASVITTTGYSTVDFDKWNSISKLILVLLMFIGACAGSTGGGIKVSRIVIWFKSIIKEIKMIVHPKSTAKVTFNGRVVEHETLRSVNAYFSAYAFIFFAVMLVISLDNFDFTTNFTATLATLNNIGPGLSKVGPMCNFSVYSNLSTFVLSLAMIIGRLEIFPMLILFSKNTWKK